MAPPRLRVIDADAAGEFRTAVPVGAIVTALIAVVAALASLALGGINAREDTDARDRSREILDLSLQLGNRDPLVRRHLTSLRRDVGENPLDAMNRVMYAGTLLGLSRSTDDTRAASFHAGRAAGIAPVTVPVVQRAAQVLGRCGKNEEALELTSKMFLYDPRTAASLLAALEQHIGAGRLEEAVPDSADAWLAWSRKLRELGRTEVADSRLERANERWPEHIPVLKAMTSMALGRRDWERLSILFPEGGSIPHAPRSALLFTFRARLHAHHGNREAALRDVDTALDLSGGTVPVLIHAGDAMSGLDEFDLARTYWHRALYRCPAGSGDVNHLALLFRLARLEDKHGKPATALRLWREVLSRDPGNREAVRRIDTITNFHR